MASCAEVVKLHVRARLFGVARKKKHQKCVNILYLISDAYPWSLGLLLPRNWDSVEPQRFSSSSVVIRESDFVAKIRCGSESDICHSTSAHLVVTHLAALRVRTWDLAKAINAFNSSDIFTRLSDELR